MRKGLAVACGRAWGTAILCALVYETALVGLETYGYSLSRRSSYMVFFNAILTAAATFLLARGFVAGIRAGAVRGAEVWICISLAGGLIALYAAWVADRWLRLGPMGEAGAGFNPLPGPVFDHLIRFHEKGYWGWGNAWYFDREPVKGTTLTIYWTAEAVLFLVLAPFLAQRRLSVAPFCETCGSVLEGQSNVRRLQASRAERAARELPAGDYSVFDEPRMPLGQDRFTLQFDVARCPACADSFFVSMKLEGKILLYLLPASRSNAFKVFPPVKPRGST